MKTKLLMKHHIFLTGLLCSLLFVSCNKTSKSETETIIGDYKAPETIPLKFTEPEPFEWETITNDTLTTPVTYDLNVDELPSEPFELNTFKPLESPMKEYDLEWGNMPIGALKYDSVPFTITTAPIKKPTITKMKPPSIMAGTNANLQQLSANEGLSNNDITSFVETEDGAIWIGTSTSSVMRYDGENTFTYDYSGVYKMTLDQQGKLWLMRPGPDVITVLDFKNDSAYTIATDDNFGPLNILCDHTGTLFITSNSDGLFTMDAEMTSLKKLSIEGRSRAWSLFEDSNDNLWIGFRDGLAVLDKERKEFKTISEVANYELNSTIADIKEDQSGTIWLSIPRFGANASSSVVIQLSFKEEKVKVLDIENGFNIIGAQMVVDTKDNLWIMGGTEAYILNKKRSAFKTIALNSTLRGRFRLTRPLKRKDGSIWIATTNKGVVIANDFTLKTEYFDTSRGLINDEVWDIEEDSRGELWLGTTAGINIIDPKQNTIKSLSHQQLHSAITTTLLYVKEISKDRYFIDAGLGFSIYDRLKNTITQYASNTNLRLDIVGFAELNDHTFWVYTSEGLYLYDIEDNNLKKIVSKINPNILKAVNQSGIIYDDNGILWVPTKINGLAKVDVNNSTVSYLSELEGFTDNEGTVAYITEEGELWVASLNGISILNFEDNTLTNLKEENGLIPAETYDLIEKNDLMYAATVNGLVPIEKSLAKTTNKGFYNFNEGFGFKTNDYLEGSPKFLKNGQFWTGVANPSNQFKLLIMDNAPKPDSIVNTVHITKMYVRDEDPGFNSKKGSDSLNNNVLSYAKATNIKWDSIKHPYNIPGGLVLPFDQNSLSFSYASSNVLNRNQINYRFILDGEDEDWTYADTKTKTKNYYNLKPGQYTFKVASRSFNKQWSTPDILEFHISPPWWQTKWAYGLYFLLLIGLLKIVDVIQKRRIIRNERERSQKRELEQAKVIEKAYEDLKATQSQLIQSEKMASLGELTAGIAHEIQNPLNFVNNFSEVNVELIDEMQEELKAGNYEEAIEISTDIKENQKKIDHHGRRADSIVKGMLKHSRNTSGEKEPTNINAIADEYLRLAYHGLRAKDKSFNATLNTDFDESIGNVNVVGQDMGRVILNLITNALHAITPNAQTSKEGTVKPPTIWISTEQLGDNVIIKIKDNGSGIPKKMVDKIFQPFFTTKPSGQGTGLGLSMSYDIVKSHGGELKVESKEGEGTTFTISIPK